MRIGDTYKCAVAALENVTDHGIHCVGGDNVFKVKTLISSAEYNTQFVILSN